jgi:hypothetical protein
MDPVGMATDTAQTSAPTDATSALTAATSDVTAPISGVISAICAVICTSGALATRQEIWPISAATAGISGSIEGTCDATLAICSLIATVISRGALDGLVASKRRGLFSLKIRDCNIETAKAAPGFCWRLTRQQLPPVRAG